MPIKNIARKKVKDIIFEQLYDLIITGEWKPGQKTPSENALAEEMGVSRISIRSALQQLSSIGLIESRQGEGTFVSEFLGPQQMKALIPLAALSHNSQEEMNEFRMILECASAGMAASRRSEEDLAALKRNYKEYVEAVKQKKDTLEIDLEFHIDIAKASKNQYIVQSIIILKEYMFENIKECKCILGEAPGIRFHREILVAIDRGDCETAQGAMKNHLCANQEALKKFFDAGLVNTI